MSPCMCAVPLSLSSTWPCFHLAFALCRFVESFGLGLFSVKNQCLSLVFLKCLSHFCRSGGTYLFSSTHLSYSFIQSMTVRLVSMFPATSVLIITLKFFFL